MNQDLNPHAIFETFEDYFCWEKYVHQNDFIEGLTDDERKRAKDSILFLCILLGDDFLRRAMDTGNPIFSWFFRNCAPHARRSLIRIAEELKGFEGSNGFDPLVESLGDPLRAAEGLTVLDAASHLVHAGFSVSFHPFVVSNGKHPDILVVTPDTTEEIYVEVSRLRVGGHQEVSRQTFDAMWFAVHNAIWSRPGAFDVTASHVLPYVRILRPLSENEIPVAMAEVQRLILDSALSGESFESRFKDALEMAISPPHDHSKAEAWAAERGMRDFVEAPPINLERELKKVIDKIGVELDQIPEDKPGVIVIPTSESMLFFAFPPEQIIHEIADAVKYRENLLCAVLSHTCMAGKQQPIVASEGDHVFVRWANDLATEQTAFVTNDGFGLTLSDSAIHRVRRAFVRI